MVHSRARFATPEQVAAAQKELERLVRDGVLEPTALGVDAAGFLAELSKHTDLSKIHSLDDLVHATNKLDLGSPFRGAGGPLTLLQMGLDAHDLGQALGQSDEPEAWRAGIDMTLGTAAGVVPGGGIAWWGGTKIGEGIWWFGEDVVGLDTPGSAYRSAIEDMYGPGVSEADLTPQQTQALVERYEGWGGLYNSTHDAIKGHGRDFAHMVGGWFK